MRQREYGGVPWYLLFALTTSIGAGVGTYVVLHKRELRLAEERARAPKPPPPPPPAPTPTADPIAEPTPEAPTPEAPTPEPSTPEAPAGMPMITVNEAITMGAVDSVHVELRINGQKDAIGKCYATVASTGTLVFSVSIGATGRVIGVSVVGEAFDTKLGTCVSDVLKKIRFTAPSDASPAEATIPIVFNRN